MKPTNSGEEESGNEAPIASKAGNLATQNARNIEAVELAIDANGGERWRKDACRCDHSVGAAPCEYCAIHYALALSKRLLSEHAPKSDGGSGFPEIVDQVIQEAPSDLKLTLSQWPKVRRLIITALEMAAPSDRNARQATERDTASTGLPSRAAFESYWRAKGGDLTPAPESWGNDASVYKWAPTDKAWQLWQAAVRLNDAAMGSDASEKQTDLGVLGKQEP